MLIDGCCCNLSDCTWSVDIKYSSESKLDLFLRYYASTTSSKVAQLRHLQYTGILNVCIRFSFMDLTPLYCKVFNNGLQTWEIKGTSKC